MTYSPIQPGVFRTLKEPYLLRNNSKSHSQNNQVVPNIPPVRSKSLVEVLKSFVECPYPNVNPETH